MGALPLMPYKGHYLDHGAIVGRLKFGKSTFGVFTQNLGKFSAFNDLEMLRPKFESKDEGALLRGMEMYMASKGWPDIHTSMTKEAGYLNADTIKAVEDLCGRIHIIQKKFLAAAATPAAATDT